MSNGTQATNGKTPRATALSPPHGALMSMPSGPIDAGLSELLFDDSMDRNGVLEAAQISQTDIIERQAETIARLERHAARDKEYRTVTKVKLKEAAARLKDYRLRVEALMGEVDAAKATIVKLEGEKKKALAQVQAAKKKPIPKKIEMKDAMVQTPWKTAMQTKGVQTMVVTTNEVEIQTESESTAANNDNSGQHRGVSVSEKKVTDLPRAVSATTTESGPETFDPIGAAIDAELEFSDDEDDDNVSGSNHVKESVVPPVSLVLDEAISRDIDMELEFSSSSSSDDDTDDEDSPSVEASKDLQEKQVHSSSAVDIPCNPILSDSKESPLSIPVNSAAIDDAVAAAIDAELASDSEDDGTQVNMEAARQPLIRNDPTSSRVLPCEAVVIQSSTRQEVLPFIQPLSLTNDHPGEVDRISAAIDAELASSSEDDNDRIDSKTAVETNTSHGPEQSALANGATQGPVIVSRENENTAGDNSDRQETERLLHEKSRTLSLSSDSSSSSSSSNAVSEEGHVPERDPRGEISSLPKMSDAISPIGRRRDEEIAPIGFPSDDGGIRESHVEPKKRRSNEGGPIDVTTEVKPDLKKRKLEPSGEAMSTNTMAYPRNAVQNSFAEALSPKDLVAFKAAITLQQGEDPNIGYVTRTLGTLVKHIAMLLRTNDSNINDPFTIEDSDAVSKLSKMLVSEHIARQISHEALLEGMIRIFRTPRTRHAIENSTLLLTSLFQIVFFLRIGISKESGSTRVGVDWPTEDMIPEVHQCLLALRDLIVVARLHNGRVLARTENVNPAVRSLAGSSTGSAHNVDKVFLVHVGAFYTTICRAIGRFDLPIVLLVDILSSHPNIKGLYCVKAMIQVDSRIFEKRWDIRGHEQQSALRSALVHVLQVITYRSRDKQEQVFKESALSLLLSIAKLVDDPVLASINPPGDPLEIDNQVRSIADTIWNTYISRCMNHLESDIFDIAKALELLATFHGDEIMMKWFPVSRLVEVNATDLAQAEIKVDAEQRTPQVSRLLCAIARGTLRAKSSHRDKELQDGQRYVDQAVQWMFEACPRGNSCPTQLLCRIVEDLVDLLVGMSTDESMCKQRDDWLRELLRILSERHLQLLSAQSLRQLRLLVMAAQPLVFTSVVV